MRQARSSQLAHVQTLTITQRGGCDCSLLLRKEPMQRPQEHDTRSPLGESGTLDTGPPRCHKNGRWSPRSGRGQAPPLHAPNVRSRVAHYRRDLCSNLTTQQTALPLPEISPAQQAALPFRLNLMTGTQREGQQASATVAGVQGGQVSSRRGEGLHIKS